MIAGSTRETLIPTKQTAIADHLFQFLRLDPKEALFDTRGFPACDADRRRHFETVGGWFVAGYNAMIAGPARPDPAAAAMTAPPEMRGFFVEGMAMAATLADTLTFGARRTRTLLAALGGPYGYLIHVGIGWARAKLPLPAPAILDCLDPVHWWLTEDGRGFSRCYFGATPRRLARIMGRDDYAAHAFAQGVGRALWFVAGGDFDKAGDRILALPRRVRPDLWAGLGLAMTYAGPAPACPGGFEIPDPVQRGALAQGAAFAAAARVAAGVVPWHTRRMTVALTRRTPEAAAALVAEARPAAAGRRDATAYEVWRSRVRVALGPNEG